LRGRLTADAAADATTLTVESYPVPGDPDSEIAAIGDIPSGATILLQNPEQPDEVYPVAVTADTVDNTGTYTVTTDAIPAAAATGWTVWIVNEIEAGSFEQDDFFCAKIVGKLSANDE